ncbi:MAG: hypothetical protein ACK5P6_04650 [Pseudobdellovibrionaceae bacterium]|jgi:hypothetical protein
MRHLFQIGLFLSLFLSAPAHAYLVIGESAEILPISTYRIGAAPQFYLSDGGGLNVLGYVDAALTDSTSMRVQAGGGEIDFFAGASFKWVPIPDFENQPAIGVKIGANFGREADENLTSFQLSPLVSKKVETDYGLLIPYASLSLSRTSVRGETDTGFQVVGGTEWIHPDTHFQFGAELGLEAKDSYSYLMGWISIPLDEVKKLKTR